VRTFEIPRGLKEALAVAYDGGPREIDLGKATLRTWAGREGSTWFANVASAGMSGAIAKRINETNAAFGGKVAYAWSTLAVFSRWRNAHVQVKVDGEERSDTMHDVIVANGRFLAGGMKITPEAEPDDGLFDVLLIGDVTKRDLITVFPKLYRGTHLPHPKAELLRGRVVEIDSPEPLPVELDGEQPGTTPVRFEVVPRGLRLRVPS
jgi:diacylglycerol kinase (ATP)